MSLSHALGFYDQRQGFFTGIALLVDVVIHLTGSCDVASGQSRQHVVEGADAVVHSDNHLVVSCFEASRGLERTQLVSVVFQVADLLGHFKLPFESGSTAIGTGVDQSVDSIPVGLDTGGNGFQRVVITVIVAGAGVGLAIDALNQSPNDPDQDGNPNQAPHCTQADADDLAKVIGEPWTGWRGRNWSQLKRGWACCWQNLNIHRHDSHNRLFKSLLSPEQFGLKLFDLGALGFVDRLSQSPIPFGVQRSKVSPLMSGSPDPSIAIQLGQMLGECNEAFSSDKGFSGVNADWNRLHVQILRSRLKGASALCRI